jgi:hypothetical protein
MGTIEGGYANTIANTNSNFNQQILDQAGSIARGNNDGTATLDGSSGQIMDMIAQANANPDQTIQELEQNPQELQAALSFLSQNPDLVQDLCPQLQSFFMQQLQGGGAMPGG